LQNPNGPYPGRQLFVGLSANGAPTLAYLVTGRSPASRERRAIVRGNAIIIGPIGNTAYDPLRHYPAIKFDNMSGIAAVSNGVQTEAVYETYRLLRNVGNTPDVSFMEKLMEGAKAEPDSLNTPRISAIVTKTDINQLFIVAIKRHDTSAKTFAVKPEQGVLTGISTYQGDMERPAGYDVGKGPAQLVTNAGTPQELAKYLYDLSAATYSGDDIRVCAVGGMYLAGKWELAVINRHK
jgi:IMP cyclohydrolase